MHFRRLWNGMFDLHRAEISVMQFTGHSLTVHQFVTVPWAFNPVPYCQPSSPTPMEYALQPSLEWHVWRGWRSIYNTYGICDTNCKTLPHLFSFQSSISLFCDRICLSPNDMPVVFRGQFFRIGVLWLRCNTIWSLSTQSSEQGLSFGFHRLINTTL